MQHLQRYPLSALHREGTSSAPDALAQGDQQSDAGFGDS